MNDTACCRSSWVFRDSCGGFALLDLISVRLAPQLVWNVAVGDGRHRGNLFSIKFGEETLNVLEFDIRSRGRGGR